MVYKWSIPQFSVPAQIVGAECERIEKENGSVTCEKLVDSARDVSSACHNLFEWNDAVAGEKWRLQQAKTVLCCLKVEVINKEDNEPKQIKAFVNTNPTNSKAKYYSMKNVMSDSYLMASAVERAKRELKMFMDKYNTFNELLPINAAIQKFLKEEDN